MDTITIDDMLVSTDGGKSYLQNDAVDFAQEIARNTPENQLITALASDQTESRFTEQAEYGISENFAQYHDVELSLQAMRDRIHIDADDLPRVCDSAKTDFADVFRSFSHQYSFTTSEYKKEAVALSAVRVKWKPKREPLLDNTSTVALYAGIFAGVEALVVAASYLGQTGAVTGGAAPALALAITGAANNVGLGGYLLGSIILPGCLMANSERLNPWWARIGGLVLASWLLFINMLLSHYRVASGDFTVAIQNLFSKGFVFGDMVATLLFGFNALMVFFWAIKFYHSRDPIREYGRIGVIVRELEDHLHKLREAYPQKIRERADIAKLQMDEIVSDARNGVVLAKETLAKTVCAQQEFLEKQTRYITMLEDTVKFRRGVIQSLLREHYPIPAFYINDVSFAHLARTLDDITGVQSQVGSLIEFEKRVVVKHKSSEASFEAMTASWQLKELKSNMEGPRYA